VLQFEILSPCGGVHNWFKVIVTEENNLRSKNGNDDDNNGQEKIIYNQIALPECWKMFGSI
jgi:hypothetical protein